MRQVNYDLSVVVFFDVLGFGSFVENAGSPRRVYETLSLMQNAEPDEELADQHEIKFTNFSDSVVRSTNILSQANKSYSYGVLFHEILGLLHHQIGCIGEGALIRGGLCMGEVYHDDSCVFGPALNKAHWLEDNVAVYPRVIVEEETLQSLSHELMRPFGREYEVEREYVERLLRKTHDGRYFADYLRVAQHEIFKLDRYFQFLKMHRDLVIESYKDNLRSPSITQKYKWLAEYHNDTVDFYRTGLAKKGFAPSEVEISKEDVPCDNLLYAGPQHYES